MHLLTHLIWVALIGHLSTVSAQTIVPSPLKPSLGAHNLVSIRLEEPVMSVPGRVQLAWERTGTARGGYVSLERSQDREGPYELVAVLKQDSSSMRHVDELAKKGLNFYRLRWVLDDGRQFVSNTVEASVAGDMSCRFYPNPVDNVLIVQSEQPLDLLITDGNGKVRTSTRLKQGLQTVDVSSLDKGLYIITLIQTDTGRKRIEKLLKN